MSRVLSWLALAMGLDVATTAYRLSHGLSEGNPAMSAVLAHFGILGLIVVKASAFGLIALIATVRPTVTLRAAVICGVLVTLYFAALNLGGS